MNREDLEHLIRAAAEVTGEYEFVIVGSQSVLGPTADAPPELRMSAEADMYPLNAPEKADRIEGVLGEGSQFHTTFGYYAQAVGPETAVLPEGWRDRLRRVQSQEIDPDQLLRNLIASTPGDEGTQRPSPSSDSISQSNWHGRRRAIQRPSAAPHAIT
jgi:hypothetical protein